jgi:hypothetical protein
VAGCCQRKTARELDALDRKGYVDRVAVERAMAGNPVRLNRTEAEALVVRLANERRMGLKLIQQHTGYSRSQIAAILAKRKNKGSHR